MRSHQRAGRYAAQVGGYKAFEPVPLPPDPPLVFDAKLMVKLSAADTAVGRLDGLARFLPDADLFLAMYVRQEALLSSQIEGTECTLDDVLSFELHGAAPLPELDVREVVNYVAALTRGVELLEELPMCNRLLREVHATLLRDGRGSEKSPGHFRLTQNWIGPAGCTLHTATFIPPPEHVMQRAMSDLEKYLHERDFPVLMAAALAHAQFETIHPFLDGNGRIGRLLVSLLLHARGVLSKPVLYLSTYLKQHRNRYFDHLMGVREDGDWEGWCEFFLDGVKESAIDAAGTAERVHALRELDRGRLVASGGTHNDLRLLDGLYRQPLVNAPWVTGHLDVTPTTANKLLERAVGVGILRETTGKKRYRMYRYDSYVRLFDSQAGSTATDETLS